MRSNRRAQRGQSLVELAIFAPIMLLILLIAVDFGRVFLGWVNVTNMVRIGANYAALNPKGFEDGDAGVRNRYGDLMERDADAINCALPSPLPGPTFSGYSLGDTVQVDISCTFTLLTPFLSALLGDGAGNVEVGSTAIFSVRSGSVGNLPVNPPQITPPPTAGPTASPTPAATQDPDATLPPVIVSFYGEPGPNQPDASGGGPPGSPNEAQVVILPGMRVDFTNTTSGELVTCVWDFGDGTSTSDCGSGVSKIYTSRGTYSVTLTVNNAGETRTDYVLVGCKVPDFHDERKNSAAVLWGTGPGGAGFTGALTTLPGTGNYQIKFQSIVSGVVNPPGGCAAEISVGP